MARVHQWQFLLNEVGEPISNADISVYLAGTTTPVTIYTDEFSNNTVSTAPQLKTLSNGYFEFWIADKNETFGYETTQKFKIKWEKTGIARGEVDFIDIFPAIKYVEPVDETDSFSIVKDKTLSNALAYGWESHIHHDAAVDGLPIHGLTLVDLSSYDTLPNKLITNQMGWDWDKHRISTVQSYPSLAGTPHGIEEVNETSNSTLKNKLVSNNTIYTLNADINSLESHSDARDDNLQIQIDTLSTELNNINSNSFTINTTDWLVNGDELYYDISHNFGKSWLIVVCWNTDTSKIERMADIEEIDTNTIRVTISSTPLNLRVRISN